MDLKSLSWRSDLGLQKGEIGIEDRGDYLVVRSTLYPYHVWKNFLLFSQLPAEGDPDSWRELYDKEFPGRRSNFAVAFGWDQAPHESAFRRALASKYRIEKSAEFSASDVTQPSGFHKNLDVMPVESDELWKRVLDRRVKAFCSGRFQQMQAAFEAEKAASYRRLTELGRGHWFVAYKGGVEVADMGLFVTEDGLARFQEIWTYPGWEGTGVGRSMVYQCCELIKNKFGSVTYIGVSEEHGSGSAMFSAIGLKLTGQQEHAHWTIYY